MPPTRLLAFLGILLFCFCAASAQTQCSGSGIFGPAACLGDEISQEERDLFEAVNAFRVANGKPALHLSRTLSIVGNRRMLDLTQNMHSLTHSWSNCPYEIGDEKTWSCMMDSPARLKSGYNGTGYETLYATGSKKVDPNAAVAAWKKSPLHSSIILGTGMFSSMQWDEFGVAISGGYATLWFGYPGSPDAAMSGTQSAHSGSLDELKGIFGDLASTSGGAAKWTGTADAGRLTIEIDDREADFYATGLRFFLVPQGIRVDAGMRDRITRFLKLKYPEWPDATVWLATSLDEVSQRASSRKVKLTNKSAIEVSRDSRGRLLVSIYPKSKARAIESF